jgi:hypothetical protein
MPGALSSLSCLFLPFHHGHSHRTSCIGGREEKKTPQGKGGAFSCNSSVWDTFKELGWAFHLLCSPASQSKAESLPLEPHSGQFGKHSDWGGGEGGDGQEGGRMEQRRGGASLTRCHRPKWFQTPRVPQVDIGRGRERSFLEGTWPVAQQGMSA